MRILIAEDDGAIIDVMRIILERAGHEVLHATNEKDIMTLTTEKEPQLLFLDISLGADDGGKITTRIKKSFTQYYLPIIIISANTQTAKIARKSGADGFLLKPFDIDELLNLVDKYDHTTQK